ncbi:MAG: hypothetical protein ABIH63_03875 [archaeon]
MWEVVTSVKRLERMLDKAIGILYTKTGGGCHNYGEKSRLGDFKMESMNGFGSPLGIIYLPSEEEQEKWGYKNKVLATINVKEGTYTRTWDNTYDEGKFKTPFIVMHDTDMIMQKLGLRPKQESNPYSSCKQ